VWGGRGDEGGRKGDVTLERKRGGREMNLLDRCKSVESEGSCPQLEVGLAVDVGRLDVALPAL
jgi:hypothetical protein